MAQPSTRVPVIGAGYAELLFTMPWLAKWPGSMPIYHFERYWPGLFVWTGKRRYETAQRHKQAREQQLAMHLHHVY
jgi:hypothetical protein